MPYHAPFSIDGRRYSTVCSKLTIDDVLSCLKYICRKKKMNTLKEGKGEKKKKKKNTLDEVEKPGYRLTLGGILIASILPLSLCRACKQVEEREPPLEYLRDLYPRLTFNAFPVCRRTFFCSTKVSRLAGRAGLGMRFFSFLECNRFTPH